MRIELRERHFASFFDVPFRVYDGRPFVSPLKGDLKAMVDFDRNPFFGPGSGTTFTAFADGRPVGRIAAHVHADANRKFGESAGGFGFFDLADDVQVARALLEAAEAFVRGRGATTIRGNLNLTANEQMGVLVEGEANRPFLGQVWNPEYVGRLLTACGYRPVKPMTTFVSRKVAELDPDALLEDKHRALMADPAYRFVAFDLGRFDAHVEEIRGVLNAAMADNYLFVPMTEAQAAFQLGPLKMVMDPSLFQLAYHHDRLVGVTMCVPDVVPLLQRARSRLFPFGWWTLLTGRRSIRSATVVIILVLREHQNAGITRVLTARMVRALKDGGYTELGGTWIGDDNAPSLRSARALGMAPWHRVAMFEKELT